MKLNNNKGKCLKWLEKTLYKFFMNGSAVMPLSFCKYLASYYPDARIRKKYLELLGVKIGKTSFVNMGFTVIPNNSRKSKLYIGEHVSIAPNVTCICESNANNGLEINSYPYVRERLTRSGEIYIEDEAWLGAGVTIMPGVRIGKCAVIGAGSVVTKDLDPYGIYVGVPARKVNDIRTGEFFHG